jgi:hypothetical protein
MAVNLERSVLEIGVIRVSPLLVHSSVEKKITFWDLVPLRFVWLI